MIFSKFLICAYNSFQFGCLKHAGRVHCGVFFLCFLFAYNLEFTLSLFLRVTYGNWYSFFRVSIEFCHLVFVASVTNCSWLRTISSP